MFLSEHSCEILWRASCRTFWRFVELAGHVLNQSSSTVYAYGQITQITKLLKKGFTNQGSPTPLYGVTKTYSSGLFASHASVGIKHHIDDIVHGKYIHIKKLPNPLRCLSIHHLEIELLKFAPGRFPTAPSSSTSTLCSLPLPVAISIRFEALLEYKDKKRTSMCLSEMDDQTLFCATFLSNQKYH